VGRDRRYKTVRALPSLCYVQMGMPNATFSLYPVPSAIYTVHVSAYRSLPNTVTLATVFSLPPGYEKAMVEGLAVDIAPSFGRPVTDQMMALKREADQMLQTNNYEPLEMDDGLPRRGWYSQADFQRGV
jgi:hypothetical protein